MAIVFQNYALLLHLSVARNIAFGMAIRGEPKAEITRRLADLDKKPRALSGGQRQRVRLARPCWRV